MIKSLKEGPIEVVILSYFSGDVKTYHWAFHAHKFDIEGNLYGDKWFKTKSGAKRNWERLAKLNGWENWRFI